MPSGFSAQHFAKGAPINDSTSSTSTTYSSSKIDQKIASVGGGGGSTTFLALTDTPASFSANQTVRVNAAGNALEYYTPSAGSFLGLTDTPASFSANQTVRANAAGNALEFYTPSAGVTSFLGLTDTPSSFTNGKLLYSTASGVELTTTQIVIDAGNIEVDQVNARQNDTTNIGDSSHRFNTVHCLAVQSTSGKLILPTSSGSVGQVLSIASLNGSDMTLAFSTVSSGGGGSTTALPSYPSNANGPTDNTLQYIGIGDRTHHMRVWAEGVGGSSNTYTPNVMTHVNGVRNDSGNGFGALNMPVGSSVVYSWEDGSRYPFTKMTWQMHWPLGTAVSNSGTDFRFLIGGSNDNVNWTWLGAFSPDNHSFTPPAPFASVTNYTNSGNYTATSTSYYTSNTVSSASNSAYARTFHFTNTTGYRLYRIKILDNPSSSVYNTNGGNRNLYVEFAEIEWG